MPTFEVKTKLGKTLKIKAKSFIQANGIVHRELAGTNDSSESIRIIKEEKILPSGYHLIDQAVRNNSKIAEKMNEIEKSYIEYWKNQREFWLKKTPEEIEKMFPNRANNYDYYRSNLYILRSEGAFNPNVYYYQKWLDKIAKDANKAKETSITNLIRSILKLIGNDPVDKFEVYNIRKGKAGLEGNIIINDIYAKLFAIYAEGNIQRLHIRYLVKPLKTKETDKDEAKRIAEEQKNKIAEMRKQITEKYKHT